MKRPHIMQRTEAIKLCQKVLEQECDDPASELIKLGYALQGIGTALHGFSLAEARGVIQAVASLENINTTTKNEKDQNHQK